MLGEEEEEEEEGGEGKRMQKEEEEGKWIKNYVSVRLSLLRKTILNPEF